MMVMAPVVMVMVPMMMVMAPAIVVVARNHVNVWDEVMMAAMIMVVVAPMMVAIVHLHQRMFGDDRRGCERGGVAGGGVEAEREAGAEYSE